MPERLSHNLPSCWWFYLVSMALPLRHSIMFRLFFIWGSVVMNTGFVHHKKFLIEFLWISSELPLVHWKQTWPPCKESWVIYKINKTINTVRANELPWQSVLLFKGHLPSQVMPYPTLFWTTCVRNNSRNITFQKFLSKICNACVKTRDNDDRTKRLIRCMILIS